MLDVYSREKIGRYHEVAAQAGWKYIPLTMSCYGRPHATTLEVVHNLAMAAARRFGVEDAAKIEESWWRNCSTLLAERAANMVIKCSPAVRLPRVLGGGADAGDEAGGEGGGLSGVDMSGVVALDEGDGWQ